MDAEADVAAALPLFVSSSSVANSLDVTLKHGIVSVNEDVATKTCHEKRGLVF